MNSLSLIFGLTLFFHLGKVKAQINITDISKKEETTSNRYDSSENFLGEKYHHYVGQVLFLKPSISSFPPAGYTDFIVTFEKNVLEKPIFYLKSLSSTERFNKLIGKYFTVLEISKHPESLNPKSDLYILRKDKIYLKLQEKESGDTVYYEYNKYIEKYFPFITVGFFEKKKAQSLGLKFISRGKIWDSFFPIINLKTGKEISEPKSGDIWQIIDLTIENKDYTFAYVIENKNKEQAAIKIEKLSNNSFWFSLETAEKLEKKFKPFWPLILRGKVQLGMTSEMCEASWGKPVKVNTTITAKIRNEQWVFDDNYLYFKNGILTAIQ